MPPLTFENFHYSSFTFDNKSKSYTKLYSPTPLRKFLDSVTDHVLHERAKQSMKVMR